ncbi:MAG: hypothetical protein ACXWAB_08660 [Methylobacter sp.]
MNEDETVAYEAEILRLWDELPDYAKTQSLLNKLKASCPPSIIEKFETPKNSAPLAMTDDSETVDD